MLRLLTVFLVLGFTGLSKGSDNPQISIREQREKANNISNAQIDAQFTKSREAMNKIESLIKDGTIHEMIQEHKEISDINIEGRRGKIDLPNFLESEQRKTYMSSLFKEAEKMTEIPFKKSDKLSPPIILVSFSMPDTEIKALLDESKAYASPVVLRGLYRNDFKETMEKLIQITGINSKEKGIAIDPTLFSRFDIDTVPAFILPLEPVKPCTEAGCKTPKHVKAVGSVSIDYFLRLVSRVGNTNEREHAKRWLKK